MKKSTVLLIAVLLVVFNAAAWKELRAAETDYRDTFSYKAIMCENIVDWYEYEVVINIVDEDKMLSAVETILLVEDYVEYLKLSSYEESRISQKMGINLAVKDYKVESDRIYMAQSCFNHATIYAIEQDRLK